MNRAFLSGAALALAATALSPPCTAQAGPLPRTTVRINGVARPVYFNDGDTYKMLAGPWRMRSARLAGFNTLESFGPVHQWGGWTGHELYAIAKQATRNARIGLWNCAIDPESKDGYGRMLALCPDLAEDQIRKGLAHPMSVDGPAPVEYIAAARDAISNHRGMWKKGVPPAVLTSVHSVDERQSNADNYNRLVSPLDGTSLQWRHQDKYDDCQNVCWNAKVAEEGVLDQVVRLLRRAKATRDIVRRLPRDYLIALLGEYVATGRVAEVLPAPGIARLKKKLDQLLAAGRFGALTEKPAVCMVYVGFARRYGFYKPIPECLRDE